MRKVLIRYGNNRYQVDEFIFLKWGIWNKVQHKFYDFGNYDHSVAAMRLEQLEMVGLHVWLHAVGPEVRDAWLSRAQQADSLTCFDWEWLQLVITNHCKYNS